MEIKKTEKASLENKRVLFVEVGLVVALLIVLLGFGWSTKDARVSMLVDTTRPDEESDITCIELPSPPQPEVPELPKLSDVIDIVDDDIKLDEDLFVNLEENGLGNHQKFSGKKIEYFDPEENSSYTPYVIETSIGVDRMVLAVLAHSYTVEPLENGEERVVMKIPAPLAPIKVAVMPLVKKDGRR